MYIFGFAHATEPTMHHVFFACCMQHDDQGSIKLRACTVSMAESTTGGIKLYSLIQNRRAILYANGRIACRKPFMHRVLTDELSKLLPQVHSLQ